MTTSLYIPTRPGIDALLELDELQWQPLAGALGPLELPVLLAKLTSTELTTRESVITALQYSTEYRSQTDHPAVAQMLPFLLAMTADPTVAWRRETMRTAVLACEWALNANAHAPLAAAQASKRWLDVVQNDPSEPIAYGAKLMSTICSDMNSPALRDELNAVSTVLWNQAEDDALDEDERTVPPLDRAVLEHQVHEFTPPSAAGESRYALYLARECTRAQSFDLALEVLARVGEPSLQPEAILRRFEALHGLGRLDEATELAHEQAAKWFGPHEEWTIRAAQLVSMLKALADPTSVELLEKVKAKARREIEESDAHQLMKAHLVRLFGLE